MDEPGHQEQPSPSLVRAAGMPQRGGAGVGRRSPAPRRRHRAHPPLQDVRPQAGQQLAPPFAGARRRTVPACRSATAMPAGERVRNPSRTDRPSSTASAAHAPRPGSIPRRGCGRPPRPGRRDRGRGRPGAAAGPGRSIPFRRGGAARRRPHRVLGAGRQAGGPAERPTASGAMSEQRFGAPGPAGHDAVGRQHGRRVGGGVEKVTRLVGHGRVTARPFPAGSVLRPPHGAAGPPEVHGPFCGWGGPGAGGSMEIPVLSARSTPPDDRPVEVDPV